MTLDAVFNYFNGASINLIRIHSAIIACSSSSTMCCIHDVGIDALHCIFSKHQSVLGQDV